MTAGALSPSASSIVGYFNPIQRAVVSLAIGAIGM